MTNSIKQYDATTLSRLAYLCWQAAIPFVVFETPGNAQLRFFSNPGVRPIDDDTFFKIVKWGESVSNGVVIRSEMDADATNAYLTAPPNGSAVLPSSLPVSTDKNQYLADVSRLIDYLHNTHGKVVISRALTIPLTLSVADVIERLLDEFGNATNAMRYLYWTPSTGLWCGMTPETVLSTDLSADTFSTIALAGTRSIEEPGDWDDKNIDEHRFVVNYICEVLSSFPLKFTVGEMTTLRAGAIEHLMTPFAGKLCGVGHDAILQKLHPTPAIAGMPVDKALAAINAIERHQRECYGGLVSVGSGNRVDTYLNLRCAKIDSHACTLYAGGGITANSDAATEWRETIMKMLRLLRLLR
jgi:isochorismate synthase